jgi:DNA/RNA endonuclease YhcR with UshA esterase domain
MNGKQRMKQVFAWLGALALLTLISPLTAVQAQTRAVETRHAAPYYDITKEVTLKGTVASVVRKPSPEMIVGSHLLLTTASGAVDASLGRFGLEGKGALSVTEGQQIEVTGVMKTLKGRQVFVVRTVKAGGQVYMIRNEHGIPVSPQGRERAGKSGFEGGQL